MAALSVAAVGPVAISALGIGSSSAGAALLPKVVLPQAVPKLPAGTAHLGAAPSDEQLHLDVVLAGQDPSWPRARRSRPSRRQARPITTTT